MVVEMEAYRRYLFEISPLKFDLILEMSEKPCQLAYAQVAN
jgi:hypothetical protein